MCAVLLANPGRLGDGDSGLFGKIGSYQNLSNGIHGTPFWMEISSIMRGFAWFPFHFTSTKHSFFSLSRVLRPSPFLILLRKSKSWQWFNA